MPFHFEETPSTQMFLKELILSGTPMPHLEYALADVQTAGLGRQGRTWVSEKGNLFLSVFIRDFSLSLTWIPHWVGISLLEALQSLNASHPGLSLKWPNDLMFEQTQKVAGILCEKVGEGVVAGIGVNIVSAPMLEDRDTASIQSVVGPRALGTSFYVQLAKALIEKLGEEPSLEKLQKLYAQASLLKAGHGIAWTDLQTKVDGQGQFLRYGQFGELVALENQIERSLYSEEIRLKAFPG